MMSPTTRQTMTWFILVSLFYFTPLHSSPPSWEPAESTMRLTRQALEALTCLDLGADHKCQKCEEWLQFKDIEPAAMGKKRSKCAKRWQCNATNEEKKELAETSGCAVDSSESLNETKQRPRPPPPPPAMNAHENLARHPLLQRNDPLPTFVLSPHPRTIEHPASHHKQ